MSDPKPLLIKSSDTRRTTKGVWEELTQAWSYIKGIETPSTTDTDAEVFNSMVTGVPTVWARARLFKYAFKNAGEDDKSNASLLQVYRQIRNEWKGLLALLAIFPGRITIKDKIIMDPKTDDLFAIPGAFGRLLFDDIDLWCEPDKIKPDQIPFIQLIYYNDILVGATSPYTMLFTAVDYSSLPSLDIPWFRNGKFEDPFQFGLSPDNLQRLLILAQNINEKLEGFYKKLYKNRVDKEDTPYKEIHSVVEEIIDKITGQGIVAEGSLGELRFAEPFYDILNYKQTFFFGEGRFSKTQEKDFIQIDPSKLLLDSDYLYLFTSPDSKYPLSEISAYFIKVQSEGETYFAALPLSAEGLKIFFHQVGDLVMPSGTQNQDISSNLSAYLFNDKLKVELRLKVGGVAINPITREYGIKFLAEQQRCIIMWPGFISQGWNQYFLYSEYPSNHVSLRAMPFFKMYNAEKKRYEPILNEKNEIITIDTPTDKDDIKIAQLVKYPVDTASSDDWPYEIIRSSQPLAGVELRMMVSGKYINCGYLVVKKPDTPNMYQPIKDLNTESSFKDVKFGIDFGSNNTAMSYSVDNEAATPLAFKNMRRFLLGSEVVDLKHEQTARKDELLFFQNEEPKNGQVKSWIHDHKEIYALSNQKEGIAGGVPVFEPNIKIHDMDSRTIKTNAGNMHYNTKWLTDQKGQEKKGAFLRSIVLMAAASLYSETKKISEIKWSYPGSFSKSDVNTYKNIFDDLSSPYSGLSTFKAGVPITEAEAVSKYVLNTGRGYAGDNLILGIDVGGSTSDILIIAGDRKNLGYVFKKQSSLRLASGILADVILKSPDLRNTLYLFQSSADCPFRIAGIDTIKTKPQTSPFYLNSILDRLQTEDDFNRFYRFVAGKNPAVFAIPAYISGLLLFFAGQLVANVVKGLPPEDAQTISRVDFYSFGKGGKIFEWLYVFPGTSDAESYYKTCFKSGLGNELNITLDLGKRKDMLKDTKLEVAKGLTSQESKGLSYEDLAKIRSESDIIGEKGYKFHPRGENPIELSIDAPAIDEYFTDISFSLELPKEFVEFNRFLDIFLDFSGQLANTININELNKLKSELYKELMTFISSDPEYIKAMNSKDNVKGGSGFRHSLLIYEGMCYLHKHLIPNLFK